MVLWCVPYFLPNESDGRELGAMVVRLGGSGYSYDVVNGLHRTPDNGSTGQTAGNRERFQIHRRSYANERAFAGLAVLAVLLLLARLWYVALPVVAGLVYWVYWSAEPASRYLAVDPATGYEYATDERAKLMLGYGSLDLPYIQQENKLRSLIVSAKTLPPEMCDETCSWRCVELDDAKVVFEVRIGDVNGAVQFFQRAVKEFAPSFGDPDRHVFEKTAPSVWKVVFFSMPKDLSAGVSWS